MTTTRNKRNSNSVSSVTDFPPSKKSDDGSSQEEDMSDPKWNQHPGGAAALRFSARVVEKQEKLLQKQCPVGVGGGGTSGGGSHTNPNPVDTECLLENVSGGTIDLSLRNSKKKRNWTLWSSDDKQYFFEGLNEFGKDFDAIQNYISLKLKSKRSSMTTKNKDQVRHFYYRTWNKISKFLTFPEMKKAHQELYGLVNYGELRKKQRVLNLKTAVKLSELVLKGSTTIKVRGKTFRIKTPVCRALKKLNRLEEPESKLPNKVTLELLPQNGQAWAYVQNLSYNPRVRVHLCLQRSLSSVIKFFEERWKGIDVKMKEQLLQTFGKQIPRLRFIPHGYHQHHLPHFKVLEATSASKISLRNYADSLVRPERKVDSGGDEHENDFDTEDERMPEVRDVQPTPDPSPQQSAMGQAVSTFTSGRHEDEDFLGKCTLSTPADCVKGWTSEEAGMITLGEVYVMLGNCSTIHFEYRWDYYENSSHVSLISKLVATSNLLKKKKCGKTKVGSPCPNCGYNICGGLGGWNKNEPGHPPPLPHHSRNDPKPHPLNLDKGVIGGTGVHVPLQFLPTLTLTPTTANPTPEPTPPPTQSKSIILLPKGNRRLGRPANRKVIVPRVLPLRPKIDPSTTPIFTITATQSLLHTVHPGGGGTLQQQLSAAVQQQQQHPQRLESPEPPSLTPSEFNDLIRLKPSGVTMNENSNFSLSSFLDMTLPSSSSDASNQAPNPCPGGGVGRSCLTTDKFLSCDDNSLLNLLDCKQSSEMMEKQKSEENLLSNGPWLTSESNDLSLSSLLGNLEGNSVECSHHDPTVGSNPNGTSYLDDEDCDA